jgi:hypothetical protein
MLSADSLVLKTANELVSSSSKIDLAVYAPASRPNSAAPQRAAACIDVIVGGNSYVSAHTLTQTPQAKGDPNVNTKTLIWAGLIGLASAVSASADETKSGVTPSVIGFLDTQTGVIRPLMTTTASPDVAAASTALTGELKITGTITIVSPSIGATTPVTCSATAVLIDPNGPISEVATSPATRSGATATCTVLIPYEWILQAPTIDMVSLSVSVSALPTAPRIHTRQLATFKVPANATTTSFTFVGRI